MTGRSPGWIPLLGKLAAEPDGSRSGVYRIRRAEAILRVSQPSRICFFRQMVIAETRPRGANARSRRSWRCRKAAVQKREAKQTQRAEMAAASPTAAAAADTERPETPLQCIVMQCFLDRKCQAVSLVAFMLLVKTASDFGI